MPPSSSKSTISTGTSPTENEAILEPVRLVSSTRMTDSIWLFDQSRSANVEPANVILTSIGPELLTQWANDTCEAPCPTTNDITVEETDSHPREFLISRVASTLVASLDPRLSTLAVTRNCSEGLGMDGSVLTAPSLRARSIPCGLWMTGNVTDCSLSSSLISSMLLDGSSETVSIFSPTVEGFQ